MPNLPTLSLVSSPTVRVCPDSRPLASALGWKESSSRGLQHPLPGLGSHVVPAVQRLGRGGDRHPGQRGHVADSHRTRSPIDHLAKPFSFILLRGLTPGQRRPWAAKQTITSTSWVSKSPDDLRASAGH